MRLPIAVLVVAVADACDSAPSRGPGNTSAQTAGSTVLNCDTTSGGIAVRVAVAEYIRLAEPAPQRFLSGVGPEGPLMPEAGFRALQDKGPTYLYPADPAGQATVRKKLAEVGPYTSLLVTYGGMQVLAGGNEASVRLGGQYVGGTYDGRGAAARVLRLRCDGATWVVGAVDEARSA